VKLRIRHTKLGKVRFTSHRDTARHWERAVRKAGVRVSYSAGFTPRPKLSFGLALPTGAESLAEYLDMELEADQGTPAEIAALLGPALPTGYELVESAVVEGRSHSLQDAVVACTWQLHVAGVSADALVDAAERVVAAASVPLARERKGQRSIDDVRPAIERLSTLGPDLAGRPRLEADLCTTGRGLRPSELMEVLFPEADVLDLTARLVRTHQWIDEDGTRRELLPSAAAGRAFAAYA